MWDIPAIGCPPLALIARVMITHLRPRIKLCGHWLRLTADFGMVIALLTYHIATAVHYGFKGRRAYFLPLHVRVMHPVHVRADRPRRLDPHRDRPPRGRDSRWPIPITSLSMILTGGVRGHRRRTTDPVVQTLSGRGQSKAAAADLSPGAAGSSSPASTGENKALREAVLLSSKSWTKCHRN